MAALSYAYDSCGSIVFQRRTERCCLCGFCRDDARSCDGLAVRVYVDMADAVLSFCYSACCKPYSQKYSELSLDESDRSYSGAVSGAIIWRNPEIDVVLINYVLPALIATVILSAPLYLIIRQINKKLGVENNTDDILTAFEDVEDDEDKVRY